MGSTASAVARGHDRATRRSAAAPPLHRPVVASGVVGRAERRADGWLERRAARVAAVCSDAAPGGCRMVAQPTRALVGPAHTHVWAATAATAAARAVASRSLVARRIRAAHAGVEHHAAVSAATVARPHAGHPRCLATGP